MLGLNKRFRVAKLCHSGLGTLLHRTQSRKYSDSATYRVYGVLKVFAVEGVRLFFSPAQLFACRPRSPCKGCLKVLGALTVFAWLWSSC